MPSIKAIKQRRNVVSNMKQAMKAMNLVATAKLRKTRDRFTNTLPFLEGTDDIMMGAAKSPATAGNIYVKQRDKAYKNTGYLVFSSDRGKCGSYNINVCKAAIIHASTNGKNAQMLPIGARGTELLVAQGRNILMQMGGMSEAPSYAEAEAIGAQILELFNLDNDDGIDELFIAYTKFHTVLSLEPVIVPVLPLGLRLAETGDDTAPPEMEYDPDVDSFLDYMAPMYVNVQIYGAMLEAALCEQAARMVATDTATNNAQELIDALTLQFNRQRQGIITQEITEIVSGASALT